MMAASGAILSGCSMTARARRPLFGPLLDSRQPTGVYTRNPARSPD
jgi:hypothetical protein